MLLEMKDKDIDKNLNTGLTDLPDEVVKDFLKKWDDFRIVPLEYGIILPKPDTEAYKRLMGKFAKFVDEAFKEKYLNNDGDKK